MYLKCPIENIEVVCFLKASPLNLFVGLLNPPLKKSIERKEENILKDK